MICNVLNNFLLSLIVILIYFDTLLPINLDKINLSILLFMKIYYVYNIENERERERDRERERVRDGGGEREGRSIKVRC